MREALTYAGELCRFIREKVPGQLGLFRTEEFDADSLRWSSERCDPDDLGDFAPFMAWLGLIEKKDQNIEWIKKQCGLMKRLSLQGSGFYSPVSLSPSRKKTFFPSYPQNQIDLILGLGLLYRLTKEDVFLEMDKAVCDSIIKYAISRRGFVYGSVIPALHSYYPKRGYIRMKPQVSAAIMEELSNLYDLTEEERYLSAAMKIALAWANTNAFRKAGLFPSNIYPILCRECGDANISKENTNMCYGLLRLFEVSKDQGIKAIAEKAIEGLLRFRLQDGAFSTKINLKDLSITDSAENLTYNHMALGVFLDAFEILGDRKYLETAETGMRKWVPLQSKKGLFPKYVPPKEGWKAIDIDTQGDTLVILSRLLPTSPEFREPLEKGLPSMFLFRSPKAFYRTIDFDTGEASDSTNELKFIGGAIKGILRSWTALEKDSTLDKDTLRQISRDR